MKISSTTNPQVRDVVALHRRRDRRLRGEHLVEGPHAVGEALEAETLLRVFGTAEGLRHVPREAQISWTEVTDQVISKMADVATHQGIVGVARSASVGLPEVVGNGVLVVLEQLQDPGNVGTIVRTADALGASGVVLTRGCADVFSPKCIRSAAGSTYHLPLVVEAELDEVVDACRSVGQPVYGLDGHASSSVMSVQSLNGGVALVLGSEAHGLGESGDLDLDGYLAIPIRGRAESLNVAAAAAIAIFLAARNEVGAEGPR